MTKKEAFIRVLHFKKVFPVPFVIRFTVEAEENYRYFMNGDFDPVEDTGSYAVFSQTNSGWEETKPGYFKDYFGVIWNKTKDRTLGVVENPPIRMASLTGFHFPDVKNLPVYRYIENNNYRYPGHFHILSIGFTLFERAWSLTGMEQLMMWMLTEPAFVHDLLDKITDYNIRLIQEASEFGGIDCVRFGDDWAGQHGLLMGRDLWIEYIKPRLIKMAGAAGKKGLYVAQHCCGKADSLLPDMIDAGIDLFDPFQPEIMDVHQIFEKFYGKISFLGGLSIQKTMPYGSREDVVRESLDLITGPGAKGGYIFSPSHALTADIPPENIEIMIDLANNQERYIEKSHGQGAVV